MGGLLYLTLGDTISAWQLGSTDRVKPDISVKMQSTGNSARHSRKKMRAECENGDFYSLISDGWARSGGAPGTGIIGILYTVVVAAMVQG